MSSCGLLLCYQVHVVALHETSKQATLFIRQTQVCVFPVTPTGEQRVQLYQWTFWVVSVGGSDRLNDVGVDPNG